jgi:small subunit ribosomal protein S5
MANESGTEVITSEAAATAAPAAPARYGGGGGPGGQRGGGGRGGFGGGGFGGGRGGGGGRGRRPDSDQGFDSKGEELVEKVVFINRSSKVVKGGRRFKFSALVVVGDKKGKVGLGLGKATEVSDAIRRGGELARRKMVSVSLKDATIPHEILCEFDGAKIVLRPASPGTGIIAGKTVRAVLEAVGIRDILSKSLGSKNAANVVKATMNGLLRLRLREAIYKSRGLEIKKVAAPVAPTAN